MEAYTLKGKKWSILDARIIGSLYFLIYIFVAFPTFLKQLDPKKIYKMSLFVFLKTLAWKCNTEEAMVTW